MGFAVIGGMLAATFIAIFLIPVTFYVVERFAGSRGEKQTKAPAAAEGGGASGHAPPGNHAGKGGDHHA